MTLTNNPVDYLLRPHMNDCLWSVVGNTKYGLTIVNIHESGKDASSQGYPSEPEGRISFRLRHDDDPRNPKYDEKPPKYNWEIRTVWGTSFLWMGHSEHEDWQKEKVFLDESEISALYPDWAMYYINWVGDWHKDCSDAGLMNDKMGSKTIASSGNYVPWEIQGFLMSCWLALQSEVGHVIYWCGHGINQTFQGTYHLSKKTLSEGKEAQRFFHDMNELLQKEKAGKKKNQGRDIM